MHQVGDQTRLRLNIVIQEGIATQKVRVLNNDVTLFVLSMQWSERAVIILRVMCLFISEQEKTQVR